MKTLSVPPYLVCYLVFMLCAKISVVFAGTSETKLAVSSPVSPVEENAILSFRCQVWNLKLDQEVEILRIIPSGTDKIFVGTDLLSSSGDNVFVAVRQLNDGSTVYFLTIMFASRTDAGEYICKISRTSGVDTVNVMWDSQRIEILYTPPISGPECYPEERLIVLEGSDMSLNCSSEKANPPVFLQWIRVGTASELSQYTRTSTYSGRIYAVLTIRLTSNDNGAMFLCQVTSSAFPDLRQTCHVGPVEIIPDPKINKPSGKIENIVEPTRETLLPSVTKKNVIKPTSKADVCKEFCQSTSTSTSFFWIVATVVAGSAAFAFFLIFLVCLVKLCKEEGNNNRNSYVEPQTGEEIYSEVDIKMHIGENRLNRDYMALQKQDCLGRHDMLGHNYIVTGEKRL